MPAAPPMPAPPGPIPSPHEDPAPLVKPPPDLVDALVRVVAAVMPGVAARIPDGPAAVLGRLGVAAPIDSFGAAGGVDGLLAERLLGALELAIGDLAIEVPVLAPHVPAPPIAGSYATAAVWGGGETNAAVQMLDQVAPGVRGLVAGLVTALAAHAEVAPLLAAGPASEPEVAAAHGRAHLALAVVTARAVLLAARAPVVGAGAPAVVGVALDAATRVLRERRMPTAYAAALQARRRAEYLLPRGSTGQVEVVGHRFALAEGGFPETVGEPANGLVHVVPGGFVVRTGTAEGHLSIFLRVQAEEPAELDLEPWHEIVDVSYQAVEGAGSVLGPYAPAGPGLQGATPPWPGPVRARVCARGRDEAVLHAETYEIVLWPAPTAPEVVHKATDRLGHRLRGEPEPPVVVRPEAEYRWVRDGAMSTGATVTVVTGSSPEQVLDAFGADPAHPVPMQELVEQLGIDPWVAVLPVDGAVLALEYNGWQGAQAPVLRAASARGLAASMYWNVNALTSLSFARSGAVLASFEPPPHEQPDDLEVRAALEGLRLDDYHDKTEKGLAAVARFTGRGLRPDDVERIERAGIAYRILPRLPELYPVERLPDGSRRWTSPSPLGEATEVLTTLPDTALRDLAWWAAGEAVEHAGLADRPEVAASLTARVLTPEADVQARVSGLGGHGAHHRMWMTLHEATNPDALGAAVGALESARYVLGPHAADFLDRARARAGG